MLNGILKLLIQDESKTKQKIQEKIWATLQSVGNQICRKCFHASHVGVDLGFCGRGGLQGELAFQILEKMGLSSRPLVILAF